MTGQTSKHESWEQEPVNSRTAARWLQIPIKNLPEGDLPDGRFTRGRLRSIQAERPEWLRAARRRQAAARREERERQQREIDAVYEAAPTNTCFCCNGPFKDPYPWESGGLCRLCNEGLCACPELEGPDF